jgi:hypothetical protein
MFETCMAFLVTSIFVFKNFILTLTEPETFTFVNMLQNAFQLRNSHIRESVASSHN